IGRRLARIELYLADAGARVCHFRQGRLLEIRRAGDGADEVRNQIGPALVNRLHISPSLVHLLLEGDELVVSPAAAEAKEQRQQQNFSKNGDKFFHNQGSRTPARKKRRQSKT